jgi:hypothetical protein
MKPYNIMEKTQEEILKETGGVMTSVSARGSPINEPDDEELTSDEEQEILAGCNKYSLNGDDI